MNIWILDCSNGCVTKVSLSKEKEAELTAFFDNGGNAWDFIEEHEEEFGINSSSSSFMISDNDNIYEVEY